MIKLTRTATGYTFQDWTITRAKGFYILTKENGFSVNAYSNEAMRDFLFWSKHDNDTDLVSYAKSADKIVVNYIPVLVTKLAELGEHFMIWAPHKADRAANIADCKRQAAWYNARGKKGLVRLCETGVTLYIQR